VPPESPRARVSTRVTRSRLASVYANNPQVTARARFSSVGVEGSATARVVPRPHMRQWPDAAYTPFPRQCWTAMHRAPCG